MKVLSKYMYGGKSTYENGGIPRRPPRPVRPNYVPNPRENSEVGKGLSAEKMRALRKMTDKSFDEKAKNFEYTPQTKQRRFVESLKPQTVIDKKKSSKNKESDKDKYRKYINQKNRTRKMEEGGYLGYQKPEEYKDIKLRPSEVPMFAIHETYTDLDKGNRRERREERYTKKYKKKMDKAYEDAAKERAAEMEEMEGMNERQKRRYKKRQARQEKKYSRKQTRRERRADRKGYGRMDDYLYGDAPGSNRTGGNRRGEFYIDPDTGEQMFKTRKFRGKDEPPSYTRHASIRYLGDKGIYEEGDREAHEKGRKALEEDYGIIEERGKNRTNRRETRYNRRQKRKQERQSRREKRRQRKYT
tara:strand:+ start:4234 stop:5307 length:1074 start_codon:yes stop_codon:yes gene_type:complete